MNQEQITQALRLADEVQEKTDALRAFLAEAQAEITQSKTALVAPTIREKFQLARHAAGLGIYMGMYQHTDKAGNKIGKIRPLFAGEPLQGTRTFIKTAEHIGQLPDGFKVNNPLNYQKALDAAFADDSIEGKLFIPSREILCGKDNAGKMVRAENLFALRNEGDFKNSFITNPGRQASADWYWSSTEHRDDSDCVWNVRFSDGKGGWIHKDGHRLSCRPVRVGRVSDLTL